VEVREATQQPCHELADRRFAVGDPTHGIT
jgi:hypothetical protein